VRQRYGRRSGTKRELEVMATVAGRRLAEGKGGGRDGGLLAGLERWQR
jgi:hypothetical protein